MRQLRDSDHTALKLRDLQSLGIVCFDKVPCCQKVGNLISLGSWQLLHFFTNNLADSVEESGQGGVVLPGASLPQERVLVGGLISENEDVHDGKGIKELIKSWKV